MRVVVPKILRQDLGEKVNFCRYLFFLLSHPYFALQRDSSLLDNMISLWGGISLYYMSSPSTGNFETTICLLGDKTPKNL